MQTLAEQVSNCFGTTTIYTAHHFKQIQNVKNKSLPVQRLEAPSECICVLFCMLEASRSDFNSENDATVFTKNEL